MSSSVPDDGLFRLDVVASDAEGRPISGLTAKDFALLDGGEPVKIRGFEAFDGHPANEGSGKTDPPEELILMLDEINLSEDEFVVARREVESFLRRNGGHLALPTSIYMLSKGYLIGSTESSTDGNALASGIAKEMGMPLVFWANRDPQFKALYLSNDRDPLYLHLLSVKGLGAIALKERSRPGRKLLVWVGRDWPIVKQSGAFWQQIVFDNVVELSTRLREARISVSKIIALPTLEVAADRTRKPVKSAAEADFANETLEAQAVQTGGLILNAKLESKAGSALTVADAIAQVLDLERSFYTLSFAPPRTGTTDEYRTVEVHPSPPGISLRTRSGYYNEPIYTDQPNPAIKPLTIAALEEELARSQADRDAGLAAELSQMQLTERMSSTRLSTWKGRMPGPKSRAALVALADGSAFRSPPASEMPDIPPPPQPERRAMLSRTLDYLSHTIPRLPNFSATRTTVRYDEPSVKETAEWKTTNTDRLLTLTGASEEFVLYRNGREAADAKKVRKDVRSLTTRGTFGPILSTVILDSSHGMLAWSHWEQGETTPRAVFRYSVPADKSHYEVTHCCLAEGNGTTVFERATGYHGTIAIDPASGAILRLTVEADLTPMLPLIRSDIAVEYGPVSIGAGTYICPVRSVSISRGRTVKTIQKWGIAFPVYGGFETVIGDVTFGTYHMFGSDSRLLTDFEPVPDKQ